MAAAGQVRVLIDGDVYQELRARGGPEEDINRVLRELLANRSQRRGVATIARGEALPVGIRLFGNYRGCRFEAVVTEQGIEFQGRAYESPSAAARAAKQSLGLPEAASHTNGWRFWRYTDESTGALLPLETLRTGGGPSRPGGSRLRSLGAWSSGHEDTSLLAGEVRPEPRS